VALAAEEKVGIGAQLERLGAQSIKTFVHRVVTSL
jgi:hypothetical protein